MVMVADKVKWTQTRGSAPSAVVTREDAFGYNDRSEVTSATLGTDNYAYNFDNIGNRITAEELTDEIAYTSNGLNQYTAIEKNSATPFVPTFDDDGNQLTVQTATGVWTVTYNAENRPITFTKDTTVIECKYDASGRRFEKKVTDNNVVTFWQRYVYKGFLQIAAFHVTLETVDEIETEVYTLATTTYWDATAPTATRPLAFKDHTLPTPATYFYTHDLTKNVCEILSRNGSAVSIVTTYDYTPFGAVSASNSATPNTIMFSSELYDSETSLVYYNYRHYNPIDGRWISRDPIGEDGGLNLYGMAQNCPVGTIDFFGAIIESQCRIESYLKESFVTNFAMLNNDNRLFQYTGKANFAKGNIASEVLAKMIRSDHIFVLNDKPKNKEDAANDNRSIEALKVHVNTRLKIIENAKNVKFKFGPENFPIYDGTKTGQEYFDFVNNEEFQARCFMAAQVVLLSGGPKLVREDTIHIPGDWVYIFNDANKTNENFAKKKRNYRDPKWEVGLEGENLIYLGGGKYWGHATKQTILSLGGWMEEIKSWRSKDGRIQGKPRLKSIVDYTLRGLSK